MTVGTAPSSVLDGPYGAAPPGGAARELGPAPRGSAPAPREAAPEPGQPASDRPGSGRPAGAPAARGPATRDLRSIAAPGLLAIAILAFFAGSMTVLTGPAGGPVHPHAAHPGPVPADYAAIGTAPAIRPAPRPGPAASTGSFGAHCGRNAEGHRNAGNFITAPGAAAGAHHVHDYVGNTSTDGTSTDGSLAAAGTTCRSGDRSTYFWPVLRDIRHAGADADRPGGGADGNQGHILTPDEVLVDFLGNPRAPVRPMPAFLRIVTGDAKAVTHGPDAPYARAWWTCSGAPSRASSTHYPLCPGGQLVRRTGEFPSCWNGVDTDSGDHRTHVTFPDPATGACAAGTVPIPRLRITVDYRVPPGRSFALDSFPAEQRKAVTDHFDFENLMPEPLMRHVVECINAGRSC